VTPPGPSPAEIDAAVARLRDGGLVAFPTETVYGLGGDAGNPEAVARIYALKGRPSGHPLIVHLARSSAITDCARDIPASAFALAEAFWPGPLTLVLPRGPRVLAAVTGGQDTVALRVPAHPVAAALLEAFGGPLAAPSANRYGRISPTTAAHVRDEFGADLPLVLDGGPCEVGLESTIVGWLDGQWTVLRPGLIGVEALQSVAGPVAASAGAGAPRVSGSDAAHYAPRTPTRLAGAAELALDSERVAVLARQPRPPGFAGLAWLEAPADAAGFGRRLYADLRRLDALGAREIRVEIAPDGAAWDAIRDRLRRAAAR
jgi:L-threonylcarbamoyladenylate synthase